MGRWLKTIGKVLTSPTARGYERTLLELVAEAAVNRLGPDHANTKQLIQAAEKVFGQKA
jgi:hypothetical protein